MQQATANSNSFANSDAKSTLKFPCLLLPQYSHNAKYSRRILVNLREIAIQEVHPRLTGTPLTGTRISSTLKKVRVLLLIRNLG